VTVTKIEKIKLNKLISPSPTNWLKILRYRFYLHLNLLILPQTIILSLRPSRPLRFFIIPMQTKLIKPNPPIKDYRHAPIYSNQIILFLFSNRLVRDGDINLFAVFL